MFQSYCRIFHSNSFKTNIYLIFRISLLFFIVMSAYPRTINICEHKRGYLRCPFGTALHIVSANYGRLNRKTCPSRYIKTTSCLGKTSNYKVREACQNKQRCSLYASNSVFGDPCFGTYKYLEVHYFCKPGMFILNCQASIHN